jgi:hypothetical protein
METPPDPAQANFPVGFRENGHREDTLPARIALSDFPEMKRSTRQHEKGPSFLINRRNTLFQALS